MHSETQRLWLAKCHALISHLNARKYEAEKKTVRTELHSIYHPLKTHIARWWTRSILACILVVSTLALYSSATFAAACIPGTPFVANEGSASCDMSVTTQINPGALTLTNDAAATVPGTPYTITKTDIIANFNFTSSVKDHRGNTVGWSLQASSTGITHGTTTLPLKLTAKDAGTSCTNGTCAPTTFTPMTLTGTAAKFLQAGNNTTIVVDGDYTNKTDGQFTIPAGAPAGAYTGTITIILSNTF